MSSSGVSVENVEKISTAPGAAMELVLSHAELLRELTATQGVVERKTTIPILSNFLFEAAGDRLTITATDLDLSLRTSCAATVKKEGSCTIPARKLYDYAKLLPEAPITIKQLENHWVQIRAGRSNTKMVGMARANFPALPTFPSGSATKLPVLVLRNLIAKTIFAISNEESRYTLNGALLVLKAESLAMVATDGHRLSFVEKPGENLDGISGEKRVLIPRKALQELQGLLSASDAETVEFADDEHAFVSPLAHPTLSTRRLSGQFPNFEAVMPRDSAKFAGVGHDGLEVGELAGEAAGAEGAVAYAEEEGVFVIGELHC